MKRLLFLFLVLATQSHADFVVWELQSGLIFKRKVEVTLTGSNDRHNVYWVAPGQNPVLRMAVYEGTQSREDNMLTETFGQQNVLNALEPGGTNPVDYPVSNSVTGTYYLIPNSAGSDLSQAIAIGELNWTGGTYSVLSVEQNAQPYDFMVDAALITMTATYGADGTLEGSTSDSTYMGNDIDPPSQDSDFLALGLELPPGTSGLVDVTIEHADGTSTTTQVDSSTLTGDYPVFYLEGVTLGGGDDVTFNNTEWEAPLTGSLNQDVNDGFIWTNDGTELVSSSQITSVDSDTTVYTTSTTNSNGSTTVNTRTIDSSDQSTISTTSTNTNQGESDEPQTDNATELASALSAWEQGEQDGLAQGNQAAADNGLGIEYDGLLDARDSLTDLTMTIVDGEQPFDTSVNSASSYQISIPTPWADITYTLDTASPWINLIRAVEYVILSIMGVRMFFKILIV